MMHAMSKPFGWEKDFDKQLILSELGTIRTIKDGKCAFSAGEYSFWRPIIRSAIRAKFNAEPLKTRCIDAALNDPKLSLTDPQRFMDRCNRAFNDFSKRPTSRFMRLCATTYDGPRLFDFLEGSDYRIEWAPRKSHPHYQSMRQAADELVQKAQSKSLKIDHNGLTHVIVSVDALDHRHARHKAQDLFDAFRGLLNLLMNTGRRIDIFSIFRDHHAFNSFRPGPYSTMHNADGSLAAGQIWYEPGWWHGRDSAKFKGTAAEVSTYIARNWEKATKGSVAQHILSGLQRYCRALDNHDVDPALLGLWGVLEELTNTNKERYEVTISRTICLFKDDIAIARQIALHVCNRRNRSVHAARSLEHEEFDAVLVQAELLVSRMLYFYLNQGGTFRDKQEIIDFLDCSMNEDRLERQKALIDRVIQYRKRF